jgi:hypothetical protein
MEEAGMSEEEITAVVQITDSFVDSLSAQVLNIAFARIALDGGTGIAQSASRPQELRKAPAA